jgi:hypothetical protein
MRGRRDRLAVGAGLLAASIVGLAIVAGGRPGILPRPSAQPSGGPEGSAGPVVYYEVLDADADVLLERHLDGHSLPRIVARRTDVVGGRVWSVDPTATTAVALIAGQDRSSLVGVDVSSGAERWHADVATQGLSEAVWSTDGRRLGLMSRPVDAGPTEAIVIDTTSGRLTRTIVSASSGPQGFDADGALVLREQQLDAQGATRGWRFLRIDPATNAVAPLTELPELGPSSSGSEDVDPAIGLAVTIAPTPDGTGSAVQARTLATGASRTLGVVPSVDRVAIDPSGSGVAVGVGGTLRMLHWDGGAADVWSGDDAIADVLWSVAGDYLGVATDQATTPVARLSVVERSSGRFVSLPIVGPVAEASLVRIVGGVPLPAVALPAAEPSLAPTPAPAGPDLAGAPAVASVWTDIANGREILHAQRLVPTSEGGIRVVGSLTPVDLGPAPVGDEESPSITVVPRPHSGDVLVWIQTGERADGFLWDGAGDRRLLSLPSNWPALASGPAWRPDGDAIAAQAERTLGNGDTQEVIAVAPMGVSRATIVAFPDEYDRLEGWWSPTELRVGHVVCTEGCPGRYAFSSRLRIRDGRLTAFTAVDRAGGPVDEVTLDAKGSILLTAMNEDPGSDVHVAWPAGLGDPDSVNPLGFAADGRSLLVSDQSATGTDVYRIDDPIKRAVAGRLDDPQPVRLGQIAQRYLTLDVSADQGWALTTDRVGATRLVELASRRSWSIDPDRRIAWWPGG